MRYIKLWKTQKDQVVNSNNRRNSMFYALLQEVRYLTHGKYQFHVFATDRSREKLRHNDLNIFDNELSGEITSNFL